MSAFAVNSEEWLMNSILASGKVMRYNLLQSFRQSRGIICSLLLSGDMPVWSVVEIFHVPLLSIPPCSVSSKTLSFFLLLLLFFFLESPCSLFSKLPTSESLTIFSLLLYPCSFSIPFFLHPCPFSIYAFSLIYFFSLRCLALSPLTFVTLIPLIFLALSL